MHSTPDSAESCSRIALTALLEAAVSAVTGYGLSTEDCVFLRVYRLAEWECGMASSETVTLAQQWFTAIKSVMEVTTVRRSEPWALHLVAQSDCEDSHSKLA